MTLWECIAVCFCTHHVKRSLIPLFCIRSNYQADLEQRRKPEETITGVYWHSVSFSIFCCVTSSCPLGICFLGNSCFEYARTKSFCQHGRIFFPRMAECSSWKRFLYCQLVSLLPCGKTHSFAVKEYFCTMSSFHCNTDSLLC